MKKPHIAFLFSDTGGGHRSATEAIISVLERDYADVVTWEMVKFLEDHYPWPYNKLPQLYNVLAKIPRIYGAIWHATKNMWSLPLVIGTHRYLHPTLHKRNKQMVASLNADLIVSVHWAAVNPLMWLKEDERPPIGVLIVDLVTIHATWTHPNINFTIVPTKEAYDVAVQRKLDPVYQMGMPIAEKFKEVSETPAEIRAKHGWPIDKPLILLIGGGDGMGPLKENAQAIANSGLDVGLVVVTGRNTSLKAELESIDWNIPLFVHGFVRTLPEFMIAADILVTKAGPSTICEAMLCELPVILYSRINGQEDGNVSWVVDAGAGQWSPKPHQVVSALEQWLTDDTALANAKQACRSLATPNAASEIAQLIVEKAQKYQ